MDDIQCWQSLQIILYIPVLDPIFHLRIFAAVQDIAPLDGAKAPFRPLAFILIDEVPVDAARFLFNLREPNSMVDFDLGLAVEQSMQNPVYYVQYAHARICSLLKKLAEEGVSPRACSQKELSALNTSEEAELIRALARFPQEIVDAARSYDPARLTKYAVDVATLFHKYYTVCRVKGEAEPLMQARLNLCLAARTVIRNVLNLLKITFPESM